MAQSRAARPEIWGARNLRQHRQGVLGVGPRISVKVPFQWDIEMSAGAQDLPHGRNMIHGEIGADVYPVLT
jgi:hypothetical protein